MKACQFTMTDEPLVLNEIPEPEPGPGEVVLDIKAAGLCRSDVGAMTDESWLALIPSRPITIGHEIAGVVTGRGDADRDHHRLRVDPGGHRRPAGRQGHRAAGRPCRRLITTRGRGAPLRHLGLVVGPG